MLTESSVAELLQKMNSIRLLLWASFAIGAVLSSVIAQVQSEDDSSAIPVDISRRSSGDIISYTTLQQNKTEVVNCLVDNATYLVKERQCVNNHYLVNGNLPECMTTHSITPTAC